MAMRSSWTRLYVIAASFLPLVGVTSSPRILGFASPRSLKLWRNWYVSFLFFHFYWLASVVICSLYADNTDFSSCLQVCIRSEVSHASMHTIDKFPAHPRMPACHLLPA